MTSKPRILAIGALADDVVARMAEVAELRRLPKADPALIPADFGPDVAGVAVTGPVPGAFMSALPALKIVASFGVGYDAVDVAQAVQQGVIVTNTPDVLSEEVADTALGLLLSTVREIPQADAYVRAGNWAGKGAYRLTGTLRGRKVGIFGLGRIGLAIARRVEALGLEIAYHNRRPVEGVAYAYHATLQGLAEAVDTLICIAPGKGTEGAVNAAVLAALGKEGVFISIGRGQTVDEPALIKALQDGTIMAAGMDVFANEPNVPQALIDLPNTVLLPHVGSATVYTRAAMGGLVADNIVSWFTTGKPVTPVAETPV